MDCQCKRLLKLGLPCAPIQPFSLSGNAIELSVSSTHVQKNASASPVGIVFGGGQREGAARVPGYNALAPLIKPVRDPALSLIALSGMDPTEPVMAEVPLVLNNTTSTASLGLEGYRIGYVNRYVQGNQVEVVDHSAALHRVFDTLRQAGVQLVSMDAQRVDDSLQFNLSVCNEIDELVSEYRLDALVSDDPSAAFHGACKHGYPNVCETLEDGTRLWFYGARWAAARLTVLLRAYRQLKP